MVRRVHPGLCGEQWSAGKFRRLRPPGVLQSRHPRLKIQGFWGDLYGGAKLAGQRSPTALHNPS